MTTFYAFAVLVVLCTPPCERFADAQLLAQEMYGPFQQREACELTRALWRYGNGWLEEYGIFAEPCKLHVHQHSESKD